MTTYDSINKVNFNKTAIYNHGLFSTENKKEELYVHNSKLKAFMEGGLQKNQNYLNNSKLCYIDKYDFQHQNKPTDNYQLASILSGSLNKQEAEEGVSAFIGNDVEVFEKNTTTIDMFGSAKYRNYRYGGDDHVAIVHTENVPMKAAIFVTSACHKAAHTGKFDYGHNFYAKDADALDIMLPSKDGKPDYQAMELLISAIQKLVIKDVVRYANRKIAGAKQVISK